MEQLRYLKNLEHRFRTPNGSIDLLGMRESIGEELFRDYTRWCQALRMFAK